MQLNKFSTLKIKGTLNGQKCKRIMFFSGKNTWVVFALCRTESAVGLGTIKVIENYSVWVRVRGSSSSVH